MRNFARLLAAGAAAIAIPAVAQVSVGTETGVGVGVNVPVRDTISSVHGDVTRTVDTVDRRANRTISTTSLGAATSADLTAGATVYDRNGRRIGTVQSVSADSAILVSGNSRMRVPISSIYRSADGLVTRMSRSQINAQARAEPRGRARARSRPDTY